MKDRLYSLLPAVHRRRDAEEGEPLRALLGVVEEQLLALEEDVEGLYRNWFVETCEPWVVPYLGDLLGVRGIQDVEAADVTLRAYVANTLRYRRRKGTIGVVEALAHDVTGFKARAVEYFQRLDTTQNVNHVRPAHPRTPDLRDPTPLGLVDGPLGREVHTAEVRRIDTGGGRYNIGNIGVFLWRLEVFQVLDGTAREVPGAPPGFAWYRFDPSDRDVPLFNPGTTETEVAHLAEEVDLPGPLRSLALAAGVRGVADPDAPGTPWFGDRPVLEVHKDGVRVPTGDLVFFHAWDRDDPTVNDWDRIAPPAGQVAVDPVRGRLVLRLAGGEPAPSEVTVRYHRAFADRVAAGPYERPEAAALLPRVPDFQIGVSRAVPAEPGVVVATLTEAVAAWHAAAAARAAVDPDQPTHGVICLMDSRTYVEDVTVDVGPHGRLVIVAADWPDRVPGTIVADERRPHLRGEIVVTGTAHPDQPASRGELVLDGVQVEGSIRVAPGDLGSLTLSHATIVPDAGGLVVAPPSGPTLSTGNIGLRLVVHRAITGPITAPETVPSLVVDRSIVGDLDLPGTEVELDAVTVLGTARVGTLEASNAIFTGEVAVRRRQTGCVRFSYVPEGSRTPRRFRCQPDTALASAPAERAAAVRARLVPSFTSTAWGHPGFAQLSRRCPAEIAGGADDRAEMGVFHDLKQPQREANLRAALDQYLRVGLDAGVFYVT